jgi:hypothetical protein
MPWFGQWPAHLPSPSPGRAAALSRGPDEGPAPAQTTVPHPPR